jgi:benzoyl-CoA reductase subunit D
MITAGIDCGAKNTKTIIMQDGKIIGKAMVLTGFDQHRAVEDSLTEAIAAAGISRDEIEKIFATGSGSKAVKMADDTVNDIKAMSKGANYFFPNARTVADVGAEEGRAAKLDEKGNAEDFVINEKCAAGAGVFIEAMARALEVPIEEMGPLCLVSDKEIPDTSRSGWMWVPSVLNPSSWQMVKFLLMAICAPVLIALTVLAKP